MEKETKFDQTIYLVKGGLDRKGFSYKVEPICVYETKRTYVGFNQTIHKDKIMKLDSVFRENHKFHKFHTYCLEGDQQKALDEIKAKIIGLVSLHFKEVSLLRNYILEQK